MSSAKAGSIVADDARTLLCRRFAKMLNAGELHVRIRLLESDGKPTEAWFYGHGDNVWNKEAEGVSDPKLVDAVAEQIEQLASRPHADEWSLRKNSAADWSEVDIRFHPEKIEAHRGAKLESYLLGLLFRDEHDSKQDRRRGIRRGPRTPLRNV